MSRGGKRCSGVGGAGTAGAAAVAADAAAAADAASADAAWAAECASPPIKIERGMSGMGGSGARALGLSDPIDAPVVPAAVAPADRRAEDESAMAIGG